jgi:Secretion system C-terminal sorting domain
MINYNAELRGAARSLIGILCLLFINSTPVFCQFLELEDCVIEKQYECDENVSFTAFQNPDGSVTLSAVDQTTQNPYWEIYEPAGGVQNYTGYTITIFPSIAGTYSVVYSIEINQSLKHCCKAFRVETPNCFTAVARVECGQLRIDVHAIDGITKNIHDWKISFTDVCNQPFDDFAPQTGVDYSFNVWNINTYLTASVNIELIVDGISCSRIVPIVDASGQLIEGVFIGKPCENTLLSDLVSCTALPPSQLFFPASPFQNLYLSGHFIVNTDYKFDNVNLWMAQVSTMDIVSPNYNPGHNQSPTTTTLTLENNTIVASPDNCDCSWRGINVATYGRLITNPGASFNDQASQRVMIRDAIYAVQPVEGAMTVATAQYEPRISLNNTLFTRNFIGLFANNRSYRLLRFDRNIFEGGKNLKTVCSFGGLCSIPTTLQGAAFPFKQWTYAGVLQINTNFTVPNSHGNERNEFRSLPMGIAIRSANATIRRCFFHDIDWTGSSGDYTINTGYGINFIDDGVAHHKLTVRGGGLTINPPAFNNVNQAIYAGSHGEGTEVDVSFCKMNQVRTGITVSSPDATLPGTLGNISDVVLNNNDITLSLPTIVSDVVLQTTWQCPPIQPTPCGSYGIGLYDLNFHATHFNVASNTIKMNDPTFNQDEFGIYFVNSDHASSNPIVTGTISDNTITLKNGFSGIELTHARNLTVERNTILLDDQVAGSYSTFAIHTEGGENPLIRCNRIRNEPTAASLNEFVGIYVGKTIDGVYQFNFIGDRDGDGNAGFNDKDLLMQFSDMTSTQIEIGCNRYYGGFSKALNYNNVTFNDQINRRNRFFEDFVITAADRNVSAGGYRNVNFGQMWPPSFSPNFWLPLQIGDPVDGDTTCTCSTTPINPHLYTGDDERIAKGQLLTSSAARNYDQNRYLYRKLMLNPGFVSGSTFANSFKNNKNSQPVGQLATTELNLEQAFDFPSAGQNLLSQNTASIATKRANLEVIDSLRLLNPDDPTIWTLEQTEQTDLNNLIGSNDAVYQQNLTSRIANANTLIAQNTATNPVDLWELNAQTVLDIHLNTLSKGNTNLTSAQMNSIAQIAAQCPENGGDAVIWARAIYAGLTNHFIHGSGCVSGRSADLTASNSDEKVLLFPNPTNGQFTVVFGTEKTTDIPLEYHLEAFTTTGIKLLNEFTTSNSLDLNLSNTSSGLIFLKIWKNNTLLEVKRLTIIH